MLYFFLTIKSREKKLCNEKYEKYRAKCEVVTILTYMMQRINQKTKHPQNVDGISHEIKSCNEIKFESNECRFQVNIRQR